MRRTHGLSVKMMKSTVRLTILIFAIVSLTALIVFTIQLKLDWRFSSYVFATTDQKENITITALFNQLGKADMGKALLNDAIEKLRSNHPDLRVNLNYTELHDLPHDVTKAEMLKRVTNGSSVDIVLLDQIWLGEFAQKRMLTDLTNFTEKWGRTPEWYQSNLAGGVYKGKIYGIWFETDVRGIWYWKDLLNQANVDPNMLRTWGEYIAAAKKLNSVLRPEGIEGVHLTGAS
ncbi:MAG TPA: extracellular solute-binding protein, partial [Nitrososphaeraceae archaeon]|nr:extracellular solute-binding protein [Nitrososphaeraceae archaeon]